MIGPRLIQSSLSTSESHRGLMNAADSSQSGFELIYSGGGGVGGGLSVCLKEGGGGRVSIRLPQGKSSVEREGKGKR